MTFQEQLDEKGVYYFFDFMLSNQNGVRILRNPCKGIQEQSSTHNDEQALKHFKGTITKQNGYLGLGKIQMLA
ncbi:unnamed protein product [Wuchereria bancrofti]|uniref:Uncharacterized protein n=1 Tax=Wuchereria bancrofti TaxID=6293 RepID=A0A3P7DSA2_WUCBA|nr:unnamed protein product [Wuchereria bancrofti]